MTAERFSFFLKNPEQLIQISYQELKSLVVQYPYCQNLRYLLMAKSQIENSDELEKDLQLAATYSVDRSYLYKMVNQLKGSSSQGENFVLNDEFLELKNISTTTDENLIPTPEIENMEGNASTDLNFSQPIIETTIEVPSEPIETELEKAIEEIEQKEEIELDTELEIFDENENAEIEKEAIELVEIEEEQPMEESIDEEEPVSDIQDENISDNSEITYMEKPKQRKSVIEQLLKNVNPAQENLEKDKLPPEHSVENIINLADELESVPEPKENFMDLSPVKEKPTLGREVLFEITNKTDKEMDALLQKTSEENPEEEEHQNENIISMNHLDEETKQPQPSAPAPKSSFKSYIEQFQPPGMMEELEEEQELTNAVEEAVEEEIESLKPKSKKDKKVKKKKVKKKSDDKLKKAKSKKKDSKKKKKKKKKKKDNVQAVVKKSIEESDDVVSETLAELLGKQGSRKKAIQMYKRLSLIFPKKSSFFAEKIEKLKK